LTPLAKAAFLMMVSVRGEQTINVLAQEVLMEA
jgi:hypothetical protein